MCTQNWSTLLHSCFSNDAGETLLLIITTIDIQKSSAPVRNRAQEKMVHAVGNNRNIQSLSRLLAIPTSTTYVD
jgi:hypothetical protein